MVGFALGVWALTHHSGMVDEETAPMSVTARCACGDEFVYSSMEDVETVCNAFVAWVRLHAEHEGD